MGFDPDAYLASKAARVARGPAQGLSDLPKDSGQVAEFNPDAYLAAKTAPAPQEQGGGLLDRAQTQLEALGNTIGAGYLAHMQAAHEKFMMPNPNADTDAKLKAQGFTGSAVEDPSYVQMRDENLQRQAGQAQRNPYDSAAGMIGGMAVTAPLIAAGSTAAGAGKVASGLGRLKDSAALGFSMGAVANPGDTQGVISPIQGMERLTNAGTGGALGVAGQGAGEGLAKAGEVARKAPQTLEKLAKNSAFKAAGAILKDFRSAFGRNSTEEIGDTLLKKGVVAAGDSLDDIARKAGEAKDVTGKAIGDIYSQVEKHIADATASNKLSRADKLRLKASELDGSKIAASIVGTIKKNGGTKLGGSKIIASVQDKIDDLASRKNLTMKDMLEFKSGIDGDINYSKKMNELPEVQQQLKHFRDVLNKKIQDRVRVAGKIVKDDTLITALKQNNKDYGHLATTQRTAADKVSRVDANNFFSLGDKMVGSAVGAGEVMKADSPEEMAKAALRGVIAAGVSKAGRSYGPAALSAASQRFSKLVQTPANMAKFGQPLIEAAKKSPQEFQALLNQFGKDPEFIRLAHPAGAK